MTKERRLYTSESVTEGHPDKICDQISDAILDAILSQDPEGRVACETFTTTDFVGIMGEITTTASVDYEKIARDTIRKIGYTDKEIGFDADTCEVLVKVHKQSPDIAMGVDKSLESKAGSEDENGAGDQGMMFGYATNETPELMPAPISYAHKLTKALTQLRKDGTLPYLRPDGKSQVTVEYNENGEVERLEAVVCSTQHTAEVSIEQLRKDIKEKLFDKVLPQDLIDENTKFFINPTGQFIIGGPNGDTGLTGLKIIVDTYGGKGHQGGGAFTGKDPSKVDRSAAYAARYVAKNIVAAGLASQCEVQLSYAIGVAEPTSISIDTYGTSKFSNLELVDIIRTNFDLRPTGIIKMLSLKQPIYLQTASYGHFGRDDLNLPWEQTDKVEKLKEYLK